MIVLADASGSMRDNGKLESQDVSIREMLDAFRADSMASGAVQVAVITFAGNAATTELALTPVEDARWPGVQQAGGPTPLGAAIGAARVLIEQELPENALQPTIILTSDGRPNADDWRAELRALLDTRRGRQAHRFGIAIGADVQRDVLEEFVGDEGRVLDAADGDEIIEFFRRITLQVTRALTRGTYSDALPPFTGD